MADLTASLAGLTLPNPLMTASGCAANGKELHRFFDISRLGAFVTKTVMAAPRSGRGTPRMAETPSGMLNSIGLQGPGIDAFADEDLPWLASVGARVLVSIAGGTPAEFAQVATRLLASPAVTAIAGLEVNISCPNVASRGQVFAIDPHASAQVVAAVREAVPIHLPVFAKLSPDVTDLVTIASACLGAGASAARRSGPSRFGPSGRSGRRCSPSASPRRPSSASEGLPRVAMRSSSPLLVRAPSRSAPPPSTTRRRPPTSSTSWPRCSTRGGMPRSPMSSPPPIPNGSTHEQRKHP